MTTTPADASHLLDLATIDPQKLGRALMAAGWREVGRRTGAYTRYALDGERYSWIVPEDKTAADYTDLMGDVIGYLLRAVDLGEQASRVLEALKAEPSGGAA